MKQLMITERPERLIKLLNGDMTLLLKKYIPKDFKGWVNVYCGKGGKRLIKWRGIFQINVKFVLSNDILLNGKVVCRFWFDEYEKMNTDYSMWVITPKRNEEILKEACLSWEEADKYSKHKPLYAWHLKNLEIFPEPKELGEFYREIPFFERGKWSKEEYEHAFGEWALMDIENDDKKRKLTHAPQKYTYVWVKEEEI
jgi:hypothetical protein